jgi:hypothetical protein
MVSHEMPWSVLNIEFLHYFLNQSATLKHFYQMAHRQI